MYSLANEDKCLSATAEIPLAGMYLNNEFLLHDLPIKYARLLYLYLLFCITSGWLLLVDVLELKLVRYHSSLVSPFLRQ